MIALHTLAFDDFISGTAMAWYTASSLYERLGAADILAVQACTTAVTGTATLIVQFEYSVDGDAWLPYGSPELTTAIANDASYYAQDQNYIFSPPASLRRFRISLSGTSPACRLKLFVTGRMRGRGLASPSSGVGS